MSAPLCALNEQGLLKYYNETSLLSTTETIYTETTTTTTDIVLHQTTRYYNSKFNTTRTNKIAVFASLAVSAD